MAGSGYRTPPSLARRADGQTVQLTPLLYATLAAVDGVRDHAEVAEAVRAATGKPVSADNIRDLVDKLRPMGLATMADGSQPPLHRSNPLLGLRLKVAVTDPEKTRRLTAPFAALFHLGVVVPLVAAFAWISWWVLFHKGLASATHEAFARPGLLLAVLVVTVLSAGFHEFGHAAAARRGGADPGAMGAGLYLIWPAFYTDVTDSYRLGRAGRLRTDLGGLYFNAIVAVATTAVWWFTRYDALLLLVATQILQMVRQLLPLVRFDGYHVLADLTGVPDLFHRIGPTLKSLVPWRAGDPRARELKPWARAVVTAWVLLVVPLLLAAVVLMVLALPRLAGTAWASAGAQQDLMETAFAEGDLVGGLARGVAMVVVVLPIVAFGYLLVRLVRQVGGAVWRRTEDRPGRRALAGLVALALLAALGWAWWPSEERYRPVQAYEGGTVTDALALASPPPGLAVGSRGTGTVMWPDDQPLPTREAPQLAAVLVPVEDGTGAQAGDATVGDGALTEGETVQAADGTWIFPFDQPLAPDEGDNQALAVTTTDGAVTYAVAFALVWADGEEPATNTNEAYAIASCEGCAAVAVAFQVVLVTGEADIAVPQNLSVAVNYDCTSCLTYSLAVQLFATLDGPLSAEATAEIEALWAEVLAYGATIGQVPLDEIQAQLTAFEDQILAIIEEEQGPLTEEVAPSGDPTSDSSPSGSSSPSPSGSATSAPSPSATGSSTASSSPSSSPSADSSGSPSASPSASTSPSATTEGSASPTAGATASPSASATP
jgi:putative peptide zinc metalloprotease protein